MRQLPLLIAVLACMMAASPADAQSILGTEPPAEELGAPLYPGASFLRTMNSLDPYFESVYYVSPEPVGNVMAWFREQLADIRMVQYRDEYEWVWAFILGKNIPFPEKPTGDDIVLLDRTPNVFMKKYQRDLYLPLIQLLESSPGNEDRLAALENAKTVIRYTHRTVEENTAFFDIIGTWRNVDRDLDAYRGALLTFNADSTYTFTLTDGNIAALAAQEAAKSNQSERAIATRIRSRNPERGKFSVLRNTISTETGEPAFGEALKSGLTEVGQFSLVIQFINMPRLTFIREKNSSGD